MTITFKVLQIVKVTQQVNGKANVQKLGLSVSTYCCISVVSTRAGINPKTVSQTWSSVIQGSPCPPNGSTGLLESLMGPICGLMGWVIDLTHIALTPRRLFALSNVVWA